MRKKYILLLFVLITTFLFAEENQYEPFNANEIDTVIKKLKDVENKERWGLLERISSTRDKRFENVLIELLDEDDTEVKSLAISALGAIKSEKAYNLLLKIVEDNDNIEELPATYALWAIGEIDIEKAYPLFLKKLDSKNTALRAAAAEALGKSGRKDCVKKLIEKINDDQEIVRLFIIQSLGRLKDPSAIEVLKEQLKSDSQEVCNYAAAALGELGDPKVILHLRSAMKPQEDGTPKTYWAAFALAKIKEDGSYFALKEFLLESEDPKMREACATALGELGNQLAVKDLILALHDESLFVRCASAESLGMLKNEEAIKHLKAALKDQEMHVRISVVEALVNFNKDLVIDSVMETAKDKEWKVRNAAIRVLAEFKDPKSLGVLLRRTADDNLMVCISSLVGLANIGGDRAIEGIITVMIHGEKNLQIIAMDQLGRLKVKKAVKPLLEIMMTATDNYLKVQSYKALKVITEKDWPISSPEWPKLQIKIQIEEKDKEAPKEN